MNFKQTVFSFFLIFSLNANAFSISNNKSNQVAIILAGFTGASSALLYRGAKKDFWYNFGYKEIDSKAIKIGLCTALITYGLSRFVLSFYTPEAWLTSFKKSLELDERPLNLLDKDVYDKTLLIDRVKKEYIQSEFPLADAFYDFVKIQEFSSRVLQYLNENKIYINNPLLLAEVESILNQFDQSFFDRLEEIMMIIKENDQFNEQVNLRNIKKATDNLSNIKKEIEHTNFLISFNNFQQRMKNI